MQPFVSYSHTCLLLPHVTLSIKAIIPHCDSNCGTPGVDILETAEATAAVAGFSPLATGIAERPDEISFTFRVFHLHHV